MFFQRYFMPHIIHLDPPPEWKIVTLFSMIVLTTQPTSNLITNLLKYFQASSFTYLSASTLCDKESIYNTVTEQVNLSCIIMSSRIVTLVQFVFNTLHI